MRTLVFLLANQFIMVFSCDSMNIIDVTKFDSAWTCSASSSLQDMECQFAFDGDKTTFWHPGHKGDKAVLELHLNLDVVLNGIKIYQYDWVTGFADRIHLMLGEDSINLRANRRKEFIWNGKMEKTQLRGRRLRIEILNVWGGGMGPLKEVQLIGCPVELHGTSGRFSSKYNESSNNIMWIVLSVGFFCILLLSALVIIIYFKKSGRCDLLSLLVQGGDSKNVHFQGSASNLSSVSEGSKLSHVSEASKATQKSHVSQVSHVSKVSQVSHASKGSHHSKASRISRLSGLSGLQQKMFADITVHCEDERRSNI